MVRPNLPSPLIVYRRLKYGFSFRRIYLGQNEYTIVEPADYYAFSKYNWILIRCNKKPYAISEFKIGRKKTKRVYLHRAIMKPRGRKLVDHRNCDGLDNRRANLHFATYLKISLTGQKQNRRQLRNIAGFLLTRAARNGVPQLAGDIRQDGLADLKTKSTPQKHTTRPHVNTIRISHG